MAAMTTISKKYSVAEYLALEIESGQKIEYYNGKLHSMSGGTIPHNRIARNIFTELHMALKEEFEVFGSDQKIFLPKYNLYVYPDAVVVAESPIETKSEANAIINPLLIVEVLSPSTSGYDKGDKFIQYQSLPTFEEYALIRQDLPGIQTIFREEPDLWLSKEYSGLDSQVYLRSVDVTIDFRRIYKNIDLS